MPIYIIAIYPLVSKAFKTSLFINLNNYYNKMNFEDCEEDRKRIHEMFIEKNRVDSFEDWVFDKNCECTPEKMAEAGFYHCPTDQEPDLVRCFICDKELDGWEPTDIPLEEHRKHSKNCPFLALPDLKNPTVEEMMKLMKDKYRMFVQKVAQKKIDELQEFAEKGLKEMEKLL